MRTIGPFVPTDGDGPDYSLWWAVEGRGRKGVTLDLRQPRGQELFRRLVSHADVVCENFRPGTLEAWDIGPDRCDPRLVWARISVFGQDGPNARRPGLDRIGMAFGGLLGLTGFPDGPPVRTGVTVSDYLTGVFAAEAVTAALYRRDRADGGTGRGGVVDAPLYGSVLRILEWTIAGQDRLGVTRQREGNRMANSAPLDNYLSSDGRYVCIVAGSDANFARLCRGHGPDRPPGRPPVGHAGPAGRGVGRDQRPGRGVGGGPHGRRGGGGHASSTGCRWPPSTTPPTSWPTPTWRRGGTWSRWTTRWPVPISSRPRSRGSTVRPRWRPPRRPSLGQHNDEVWSDWSDCRPTRSTRWPRTGSSDATG